MINTDAWRSILFVSPLSVRHLEKAPSAGADAIQLDLEDAIAPEQKENARAALEDAVGGLRKAGVLSIIVRINQPWRLAFEDIDCAVKAGVDAITLPKVETVGRVETADQIISEFELKHGVRHGQTKLLLLIESAYALSRLEPLICASKRVCAITLGPEDFALNMGGSPTVAANSWANLQILCAARAMNVTPLGFPGTIADFKNEQAFRAQIVIAKEIGFAGGAAIHPKQIAILNEVFSPSAADIEDAKRIVAAAEASPEGAIALDGKMIDAPIIARAQAILER